jgi:hypothetical protein
MDGLRGHLPVEELILMPVVDQPTALYWLEGKPDPEYQKTFDAIKDKITPVLHTVLEECLEIKPTKMHVPDKSLEKMNQMMQEGIDKLGEKNVEN